jgi:hypothetical protein
LKLDEIVGKRTQEMQNRLAATPGWWVLLAASALGALSATCVWAQLPFFPGAEGFGGTFTGTAPAGGWFSNGSVYHVTTTEDLFDAGTGKPAIGTLRGAFYDYANPSSPKQMASNRIVVFDVGGTFRLTNGVLDIKTQNNVYVAGQTAPNPVVVYGDSTQITHSNNTLNSNLIIRYMTFRRGSEVSGNEDAVTFKSSNSDGTGSISTNMIIDHASASWGTDENLSVANNNTNITVQYSIIADALRDDHAYGSLIRPRIDSSVTYHHNLYVNNASRQARFGTYFARTLTADFRNNVVYNFRDRASYAGGSSETPQEFADVNYVGNYIVAGPGTAGNPNVAFSVDKNVDARVYQSGNYIDPDDAPGGGPADGELNGADTDLAMFVVSTPVTDQMLTMMGTPFATAPVTTQTAPAAYQQLVQYAGNWWWDRDAIDSRVIGNVTDFTGVPLAAADPIESERLAVVNASTTTHAGSYDADGDGMADAWESLHGGNLVWNQDFDNDGYVNLQEYVDEIGAFPAPAPIVFNGATNSRYAQITNWKTDDGGITAGSNWQPSRFDEAQINSGTVVVDAVGQHAGVLKLGATAGSNGQLDVNSGWLDVEDSILVGAHATGQGTLTVNGGAVTAQDVVVGYFGQLRGAGTLNANVTNGGVVLPGNSPGTLTVIGNFTQTTDGVLSIDLASASSFDKLVVDGDVAYGGMLELLLSGGYMPAEGATFDVIDWTGVQSEAFDMLSLPMLAGSLEWDTSLVNSQGVLSVVAASITLAGDYNGDHVVSAADYTVWRNLLGSNTALTNETASLGVVDMDDYDAWKANFGTTDGGGSAGVVPEPGCFALLTLGLLLLSSAQRRN